MLRGQHVVLIPDDAPLATQAAAVYLNLPHSHLVELLDEGTIPFLEWEDGRRIRYKDLWEYGDMRHAARREPVKSLLDAIVQCGFYGVRADVKGRF